MMHREDSMKLAWSGKTTSPAAITIDCTHGTRLLIIHAMTGDAGAGGLVSLKLCNPAGTVAVAHHGAGTNIPTGNEADSYTCVFEDVSALVELTLTIAARTHAVYYEVLP